MRQISFDDRAVTENGRRKLMISGSIHYPRSTPATWPALFRQSREAGLTAVETYVFWNLHERERGVYDFADRLDLVRFCRLAQEAGLDVILRCGPYICAETNFGGFPAWLRDVPGIAMRTDNEPFKIEMANWLGNLCGRLQHLFAPAGGPIVLAQIENEYANISKHYGDAGARYLQWCVDLAHSMRLGIPWVMCEGGMPGAIETINEFYGHRSIPAHRRRHPDQPLIWTECWPGWYDTWGYARHLRPAQDVAYGTARFFAEGGAGINYYMWHGGTNFGRDSMYLQTTSYDFDAPFNEFGQPTTKSRHLARLHHILTQNSAALLAQEPPEPQTLEGACVAFSYGKSLHFICNDTDTAAQTLFQSHQYQLPPKSALIVNDQGDVLFNSAAIAPSDIVDHQTKPADTSIDLKALWPEPLPALRTDSPLKFDLPREQLQFTRDQTDYCWYSTSIAGGNGELLLQGVADFVRIFIDGQPVAASHLPLLENRKLADNAEFHQKFKLSLSPGPHRLDVLCCALGMIKGDWMLGFANMAAERKGLWDAVTWLGETLRDWEIRPGLVGETSRIFAEDSNPAWQPAAPRTQGPAWLKYEFAKPAGHAPIVLDLSGLDKGMAWLNGRMIWRFWLTENHGRNPISPTVSIHVDPAPGPTQRRYHLPAQWLSAQNHLVLFSETALTSTRVHLRIVT